MSHIEDICHRCGGPNVLWTTPSPLWNEVMRAGDINSAEIYDGIVCPTCFIQLAEERGVGSWWRVHAEQIHKPLETSTSSGRVWDSETWMWREALPGETPGQVEPDDAKPQPITLKGDIQ